MKQILLILSLVLSIQIVTAQTNIPKYEEYTLPNGLKVILCERPEATDVFGAVVARVGSKDDPADANGLAHYMEHMLFKGTTKLGTSDWESEKPYIDSIFAMYDSLALKTKETERDSIRQIINELSLKAGAYAIPNELSKLVRMMGGTNLNAGTAPDITEYYNQFPASQMERWLELYAHRFEEPVFRLFQSELEAVYEEKNMYSDFFFYNIIDTLKPCIYKIHPYGQQSVLGSIEDLKNPSLSKMKEFYDTWYVPGNMVLVLIGDFNIEKTKPQIEKTFGRWEAKEFPEHKTWDEKPFSGREMVEVKMSPVKMELLSFKTLPSDHPDCEALDVCNYLIANEGETGLLDKLVLENKLLEVEMVTVPFNDLQSTILFIIPKIIGQSLEEAEELALNELRRLHTGDFPDELLEIAKMEMIRSYTMGIEDNSYLGQTIIDNWYNNKPVEEVFTYAEKINTISKEQIMALSSKYLADDYLAFYSRMGSAEKEKIDKPGYKSVAVKEDRQSEFSLHLETIPVSETKARYVDFGKDISINTLAAKNTLYTVNNPENNIFTLAIRYGIGTFDDLWLDPVASIMNYATIEGMSLDSLKKSFALLGASYSISSSSSYLIVDVKGIEENFEKTVQLLGRLIEKPIIDESYISNIADEAESIRKMEDADADAVAEALFEYVVYSDKSRYLNRPALKELKKTTVAELTKVLENALSYQAEIHYCGTKSAANIKEILEANYNWNLDVKPSNAPAYRIAETYPNDNIIIVDKPKATQSKIIFYVDGTAFYTDDQVLYDAFNFYFGGSFSGLVMQEIREYRSLAYSTGGGYLVPPREELNSKFWGYIGTQDDKTVDAVAAFTALIKDMPLKSERIDYIKEFLLLSSMSSRPHFRDLSRKVAAWQYLGLESDPNEELSAQFKELKFNDIYTFYKEMLKGKPITICIVGDKSRMNVEELEKFGKISYMKEKDLYTK